MRSHTDKPQAGVLGFMLMIERGFWELDTVTDKDLERELHELVARGRAVDARVVAHLAEVEARRLHLKSGAASLFVYCQRQLRLSENQAFYRITAARVGRRFPIVFSLLEQGELCLSAIALLSKHLTTANHEHLLNAARGKTKLQLLEFLPGSVDRVTLGVQQVLYQQHHFDLAPLVRAVTRPALGR